MSFIAGAYTATWNGNSIGQIENGYDIEEPGAGASEMIRGDNLGPGCDQDGVYLPGNMYVSCVLLEYDATALNELIRYPYLATNGGSLQTTRSPGAIGYPGQLLSGLYKALVLTKVAGTNATPTTTRIFHLAGLAPNFPIRYLMAPRHRKVPIRFQILPSVQSNIYRHFTDV